MTCALHADRCAENGAVRLTGGAASEGGLSQYGRLEVFNEGGWGSVCSRRGFTRPFTPADADVACRSLGFAGGIAIKPQVGTPCIASSWLRAGS